MSEKKIKIVATIPQVIFDEIEVEISEEMFENSGDSEIGEYVWKHLSEYQKDWCPNGLKGFHSALEVGYSTIERVKQ